MRPTQCLLLLPLALLACSNPTSRNYRSAEPIAPQWLILPPRRKDWQPLFNHENLDGWEIMPGGEWQVKDGVLVGTSPASEERHGILVTDQEYDDFKLRVVYKANQGNSGLYFRRRKGG